MAAPFIVAGIVEGAFIAVVTEESSQERLEDTSTVGFAGIERAGVIIVADFSGAYAFTVRHTFTVIGTKAPVTAGFVEFDLTGTHATGTGIVDRAFIHVVAGDLNRDVHAEKLVRHRVFGVTEVLRTAIEVIAELGLALAFTIRAYVVDGAEVTVVTDGV